ncbi:VOC family protein [bacterium]|nr:MAG: VOC family protein [bacterium]
MQRITPFLWLDGNAEEAASLYVSLFPNSKITNVSRYGEEGPGPAGTAMVVNFELFGQSFIALNGGPMYKFTEAVSFMVNCETQEEIDRYWSALTEGGEEVQCGWLKDKYGLSWQITPTALGELLGDPDPEKTGRVMQAMMGMVKLDIADLCNAYDGR